MNLDISKLLVENILLSVPYSIFFVLLALQLCGFKNKIILKPIAKFALIQSIIDIIATVLFPDIKTFSYLISGTVLIYFIFEVGLLSSLISVIFSMLFCFFSEVLFSIGSFYILGLNIDTITETQRNNISLSLTLFYIYSFIIYLLLIVLYKKDIKLVDLKKYKFLADSSREHRIDFNDNIKVVAMALAPTGLFIFINYSIYYYGIFNTLENSSYLHLLVNSLSIIISNIVMFYLAKKIINLRHYKVEWESQQKYLGDINELLKRLRAQKHGFVNHVNIINGLLTLKNYDDAQEYILNIHETVSTKSNVISVENPTINALLNAKAGIAESKKIKFEVNIDDDLSQLNFKAFEIGEAIGNIIDNAFEATHEQNESSQFVNINIFSNNNYYIFDIQNSGKTISKHLIEKLFEEGFSTKDYETGDHGFGLFISKHIIEYHQGKIEVKSANNNTSFKIYLPKVIKNEFKAS